MRFGHVVVDAGYGISAAFRHGLSGRGLTWAAGIPRVQNVYSTGVGLPLAEWRPQDGRASTLCRARSRSQPRRPWPAPSGAG